MLSFQSHQNRGIFRILLLLRQNLRILIFNASSSIDSTAQLKNLATFPLSIIISLVNLKFLFKMEITSIVTYDPQEVLFFTEISEILILKKLYISSETGRAISMIR